MLGGIRAHQCSRYSAFCRSHLAPQELRCSEAFVNRSWAAAVRFIFQRRMDQRVRRRWAQVRITSLRSPSSSRGRAPRRALDAVHKQRCVGHASLHVLLPGWSSGKNCNSSDAIPGPTGHDRFCRDAFRQRENHAIRCGSLRSCLSEAGGADVSRVVRGTLTGIGFLGVGNYPELRPLGDSKISLLPSIQL